MFPLNGGFSVLNYIYMLPAHHHHHHCYLLMFQVRVQDALLVLICWRCKPSWQLIMIALFWPVGHQTHPGSGAMGRNGCPLAQHVSFPDRSWLPNHQEWHTGLIWIFWPGPAGLSWRAGKLRSELNVPDRHTARLCGLDTFFSSNKTTIAARKNLLSSSWDAVLEHRDSIWLLTPRIYQ